MVVFRRNKILQLLRLHFIDKYPFSSLNFLLLSSIRPGQPYKRHSGILRFPGRGVMGPGVHSPGVLMLLQIVAPLLVLGSPDTRRGYREWGESRWDGLRGGLSPGVSAISTCTGELTMAAVGRKGELDAIWKVAIESLILVTDCFRSWKFLKVHHEMRKTMRRYMCLQVLLYVYVHVSVRKVMFW